MTIAGGEYKLAARFIYQPRASGCCPQLDFAGRGWCPTKERDV